MPSIQFDAAGEVVDYNDNGETVSYGQGQGVTTGPSFIGDPNQIPDYTDDELAAALPFTNGIGSEEQAEIDRMRADEKFCVDKANEIARYNADGSPVYVRSADERKALLGKAKGLRDGMPYQLAMSQRSIARRYLDGQKANTDAQQQLADYAALEQKAREKAFDMQAEELANLMIKRGLGGQRK